MEEKFPILVKPFATGYIELNRRYYVATKYGEMANNQVMKDRYHLPQAPPFMMNNPKAGYAKSALEIILKPA